MLTSIRQGDGTKVIARDVQKEDGPFFCANCQSDTILRKGLIKTAHFAHKPPVFCQYGLGESEKHRVSKQTIFDYLLQNDSVTQCEMEKNLGNVRPDIYFVKGMSRVAVELQISTLTARKIIERTEEYERLGVYVLWLGLYDEVLNAKVYAPKQWEKWLHSTYYGKVYYWQDGLNVIPIHFDEHRLQVEESSWYESGGEYMSAGGYSKKSKRYRTPNHGYLLNIVEDFRCSNRLSWSGGDILVPKCKIWNDKYTAWWKPSK